jgi:hypothetical protein
MVEDTSQPKEIWTRRIPRYVLGDDDLDTPVSPASSRSSSSHESRGFADWAPPQPPAQLKGHLLNVYARDGEKKEDSSVLAQPSHSILGHLGVRTSTSDGLLSTTVTMRYKHKVIRLLSPVTNL